MDFPQTERYMAIATIYILKEYDKWDDKEEILSVFATREAAEMARKFYEDRNFLNSRFRFHLEEREVLDKTTISKSEGPETPAVGEGEDS